MALVVGSMLSSLANLYGSINPSPYMVGAETVNAFQGYISGAQNVAGGSFTGIQIGSLRSTIGSAFAARYPSGSIAGVEIAKEFINALLSLTTVYQTGPPAPVGAGGFISDMSSLFAKINPSGQIFGIEMAKSIHQLCSTAIVNGVVPGSPPTYFTGPLQ